MSPKLDQTNELPGLELTLLERPIWSFQERLEFANEHTDPEQLEAFYRSQFPGVKRVIKVKDRTLQRQGIDTMIELESERQIYFDEKIRKKNYGDFLAEEYSVWPTPDSNGPNSHYTYPWLVPPNGSLKPVRIGKCKPVPEEYERFLVKGWIHGEKRTDYITYVCIENNLVRLIPFLLLQRAWSRNYTIWLGEYGRVYTQTNLRGTLYYTTSIPVPWDVLYSTLYKQGDWKKASNYPLLEYLNQLDLFGDF